jgi:hypothetical protein
MAIIAKNSGTARELIPAGTYAARCYQMIEIGTVKETILGTEKTLTKVRVGWELPTETRVFKEENGEQPFVISKEFTLSMNEKANLRKSLESWRGKGFTEDEAKGFDMTKLLGQPCMLNIIHKPSKDGSRHYEEIAGIMPMPKGMQCPPQVNKSFVLSYDRFDLTLFESLPDFIKDKMKLSAEYVAMQSPNAIHADKEPVSDIADDLPF